MVTRVIGLHISRLLAVLLVLTVSTWGPTWGQKPGSAPPPAQVTVDPVDFRQLSRNVPIEARLVATQGGAVASAVAGLVADFPARVGQRVLPGMILLHLDTAALKIRRAEQKAEIARLTARQKAAGARRDMAAGDAGRFEKLRGSASFTQSRFERLSLERREANNNFAESAAAIQVIQAKLRAIDLDIARSVIKAPYPGIITRRHTEQGAYLTAGAPALTLLNDRNLEIEADIPVRYAHTLRPGIILEAALDGTEAPRRKARLRAVIPEANALSRTMAIRVSLPGPQKGLIVNHGFTLYVPIDRPRRVLTVHKDAVVFGASQGTLFIAEKGRVAQRTVRLGVSVGARRVVLEGLKAGDLAIIRGNERLRPGMKLQTRQGKKGAPKS